MGYNQVCLPCRVVDWGVIAYTDAYSRQKECVQQVIDGGPNVLILCEHPPVFTFGRLADRANLLKGERKARACSVELQDVDRGGDITLHAPGQLVIYPIFHLAPFGKNLRWYLSKLEQVIIDLLRGFDIVATRFPGRTGVWVGRRKVASIGIGVRKWVTYHGIGLNVNTDLNLFRMIRPCGLDVQMTSLSDIKRTPIIMGSVKKRIPDFFAREFHLSMIGLDQEDNGK